MKGRLFWKIAIGFWVTFMLISEGIWLLFQFYGHARIPYDIGYVETVAPGYVAAAARTVENDGIGGLDRLVAIWPREERNRFSFRVLTGNESGQNAVTGSAIADLDKLDHQEKEVIWQSGEITHVVQDPAGNTVILHFDLADIIAKFPRSPHFNIPLPVVIAGAIGGAIFAAILAWYLTRPILQLRNGFEKLSDGDMTIRLRDEMGRRRDEIADLARDFDKMAARLQHLIGARDRLLNDVSHELRSPLARMQLAIGLARQKPEKSAMSFDRVEKETARLDELVGELLTLSRVESGASRQWGVIELDRLLDRVIGDARFEAAGVGIDVNADLAGMTMRGGVAGPGRNMPAKVAGNTELLRRAVENVVRNAVHHSPSGQSVDIAVKAEPENRFYIIRVADKGPGIPEDRIESMFDPFIRGDEGSQSGGFGLGLSIARRAIQAHGGKITGHNRPSGGFEVIIRLPFAGANGDTSEDVS